MTKHIWSGFTCLMSHDGPSCRKCIKCGYVEYPYDSECSMDKIDPVYKEDVEDVAKAIGKTYEEIIKEANSRVGKQMTKDNGVRLDFDYDQDSIHMFFGLSYSNYITLPRSALQSMPNKWQREFVKLLHEMGDAIADDFTPPGGYRVSALDEKNRFTKDPYADYERGRRRLNLRTKGEVNDKD